MSDTQGPRYTCVHDACKNSSKPCTAFIVIDDETGLVEYRNISNAPMRTCDGCEHPYVSHTAPAPGNEVDNPRFRGGMFGEVGTNGVNCGGFILLGEWKQKFPLTPCACGLGLWFQHARAANEPAGVPSSTQLPLLVEQTQPPPERFTFPGNTDSSGTANDRRKAAAIRHRSTPDTRREGGTRPALSTASVLAKNIKRLGGNSSVAVSAQNPQKPKPFPIPQSNSISSLVVSPPKRRQGAQAITEASSIFSVDVFVFPLSPKVNASISNNDRRTKGKECVLYEFANLGDFFMMQEHCTDAELVVPFKVSSSNMSEDPFTYPEFEKVLLDRLDMVCAKIPSIRSMRWNDSMDRTPNNSIFQVFEMIPQKKSKQGAQNTKMMFTPCYLADYDYCITKFQEISQDLRHFKKKDVSVIVVAPRTGHLNFIPGPTLLFNHRDLFRRSVAEADADANRTHHCYGLKLMQGLVPLITSDTFSKYCDSTCGVQDESHSVSSGKGKARADSLFLDDFDPLPDCISDSSDSEDLHLLLGLHASKRHAEQRQLATSASASTSASVVQNVSLVRGRSSSNEITFDERPRTRTRTQATPPDSARNAPDPPLEPLANPDPPFSQPENHKLIEMVKNWTTALSVVLTPRSSEIAAAVIVEGDTDEDAAKALLFAVEDYFIGETKHESEEAFLARMKAAGIVHGKCSKLDNVSVFLESIAGCVNYRLGPAVGRGVRDKIIRHAVITMTSQTDCWRDGGSFKSISIYAADVIPTTRKAKLKTHGFMCLLHMHFISAAPIPVSPLLLVFAASGLPNRTLETTYVSLLDPSVHSSMQPWYAWKEQQTRTPIAFVRQQDPMDVTVKMLLMLHGFECDAFTSDLSKREVSDIEHKLRLRIMFGLENTSRMPEDYKAFMEGFNFCLNLETSTHTLDVFGESLSFRDLVFAMYYPTCSPTYDKVVERIHVRRGTTPYDNPSDSQNAKMTEFEDDFLDLLKRYLREPGHVLYDGITVDAETVKREANDYDVRPKLLWRTMTGLDIMPPVPPKLDFEINHHPFKKCPTDAELGTLEPINFRACLYTGKVPMTAAVRNAVLQFKNIGTQRLFNKYLHSQLIKDEFTSL